MWTLAGMGITAVIAMLMTIIAYMAQSPRALMRLGLSGSRLDLRVKLFTGYALASLILMLGFFLAGVPLGNGTGTTAVSTPSNETTNSEPTQVQTEGLVEPETAVASTNNSGNASNLADNTSQTPSSGAFGGPPTNNDEEIIPETPLFTATPEQAGPSPTPGSDDLETAVPITNAVNDNSGTATATSPPTATATPLPTDTPTPTITPTPIEGETAIIDTAGSTLWVRRSPGGQQLVLVNDNDTVLLENGRANQGGILWQKIRTVKGIVGWVQEDFLLIDE
ncbi:MAG: hypothetical protein GY805_24140 [Chloroflexi bacterium]|nr:hypothetical protein [Chloroflexota bacterium]